MKFIFLFIILFLTSCSNLEEAAVQTVVKDSGDISVYFCPSDDCAGKLVDFIDSAEESVYCALFDIGLESVGDKLLEKASEIEVKVITDNDYLKKFNHDFVKADGWGLMHNKFCVIDKTKLFTGSMNPTDNGAFKNNNNILFIDSSVLAGNYLAEFEEMWNGAFKKGEMVLNPAIQIGNIVVENYFCPEDYCAERVKEELMAASESIHFMTFSFTHNGIANVLLLKNLEGVLVKGVFENRGSGTEYSKFKVLSYQMDVVKDKNPNTMHHKVFIIDGKVVVTGSMNPSKGGDERNDENILIIHDAGIAEMFLEEFEKVY
jgi:phosphatidylserine/phosphatidylglycerophosphate/cardiolipin synthase-like enzyme